MAKRGEAGKKEALTSALNAISHLLTVSKSEGGPHEKSQIKELQSASEWIRDELTFQGVSVKESYIQTADWGVLTIYWAGMGS